MTLGYSFIFECYVKTLLNMLKFSPETGNSIDPLIGSQKCKRVELANVAFVTTLVGSY